MAALGGPEEELGNPAETSVLPETIEVGVDRVVGEVEGSSSAGDSSMFGYSAERPHLTCCGEVVQRRQARGLPGAGLWIPGMMRYILGGEGCVFHRSNLPFC